jgi:DNA-nicking Smr family endonuclease
MIGAWHENTSYLSGKGVVLIIHGRGLSSPDEAVLKNKVREWLKAIGKNG